MPRYKCLNKNCRNFNKIEIKSTTITNEAGVIKDSAKRCYYCNKMMENVE